MYYQICTRGCLMINWDIIINKLSNGVDITADPSKWNLNTPGYTEIYKLWQDANFNMSSVKWTNFYPDIHYSKYIEICVANELGITAVRSWISRIDPGYCAPWHWDVDDNESTYLEQGPLVRFSYFIEPPSPGHVFVIGSQVYANQPIGSYIQWENYREWHAGSNIGLTPKYMFHIIGHKQLVENYI